MISSKMLVSPRKGDWTLTFSGRKFYIEDPHPEDIDINDIAHSLSMICRYGGHSKKFFSVAQHCVYVSRTTANPFKLYGLLHDASEAYIGDVISPLKPLITNYMQIEDSIMAVIATKFGFVIDEESYKAVKHADKTLLLTEIRDLTNTSTQIISIQGVEPLAIEIMDCWEPGKAKEEFLNEFYKLYNSGGF